MERFGSYWIDRGVHCRPEFDLDRLSSSLGFDLAASAAVLRTHAFGILLTSLVALCGCWAVWTVTDGMRAFTWEASRRLDVWRTPLQLRQAQCQDGHDCGIAGDGPIRIVDFIYTRCQDVCLSSGGIYRQLADQLEREIASNRVRLFSVGFDRSHDTPEALAEYLRRFGSPTGW